MLPIQNQMTGEIAGVESQTRCPTVNRLKRALCKIRKCVSLYAEEFCDELHKDYPSLIKCWHWTREIHHLMEVGIDLDDDWSEVVLEFIQEIVLAEERFLQSVTLALQGENGEPLLEYGELVMYYPSVSNISADECDSRLKAAAQTARHFLKELDEVVTALDLHL